MWLFDWLRDTWQWIVTGFSFASLVTIICMVVKFVKSYKENKNLRLAIESIKTELINLVSTKDTIDGNTQSNINLVERIQTLETALVANNRRIGAILDVMCIVYMRSKDEDVRTAVATVISTLQYRDNKEVENLKITVEDLKEKLKVALNEIDELHNSSDYGTIEPADAIPDTTEENDVVLRG